MDRSAPKRTGSSADLPAMQRWAHRALTEVEVERFDLVAPSTARRARMLVVPVLTPGAGGMTIGPWMLLREGHETRAALVAHELVHVEQWHDLRSRTFLARYLRAYVRSRGGGLVHRAAYLAIPAEAEARDRTEAWVDRGA